MKLNGQSVCLSRYLSGPLLRCLLGACQASVRVSVGVFIKAFIRAICQESVRASLGVSVAATVRVSVEPSVGASIGLKSIMYRVILSS